jgi:hypothetical protein
MSNIARTSGALTTSAVLASEPGLLYYAESISSGTLALYDGTSSGGTLLVTLQSSAQEDHADFSTPVEYQTGLFASMSSTGQYLVHANNFST